MQLKNVYNVYRVRWEIELIFKELKSGYRLDEISSRRKEVVESFIYSAVITLIVSRRLLRALAPHLGTGAQRVTGSRWWRLFVTYSHTILFAVTTQSRETAATRELLEILMHEMVDPHVHRKPLLSQASRPPKPKKKAPEMQLANVASLIPGIAYGA